MNWLWFNRLTSPPVFYAWADRATVWIAVFAAGFLLYGFVGGLILSPSDYQQGDAYRIIYVHVPAAWMSLFGYMVMATAAVTALIWRLKVAEAVVIACAPVGASFTALALLTGMLWGKPMWGAYWVWDARLTSELIMLFLYLGVISLNAAMNDPRAGARAASYLAIVGVVNVFIVHYSVEWWNSLHQPASITKLDKPSMPASMLWPLLSSALGFTLFSAWCVIHRVQADLLWRERNSQWTQAEWGTF